MRKSYLVLKFISCFFIVTHLQASELGFLRSLISKSVQVFSSRNANFQDALVVPLCYTKKSIRGLAYTLTNKMVIETLLQKAKDGVPVELIVDASVFSTVRRHSFGIGMVLDETRGLNKGLVKLIQQDNVEIRVYSGEGSGLMHCKSFIMEGVEVDKQSYNIVHSGSANCTHAGLNGTNCEVSHIFNDSEIFDEYVALYEHIKESSKEISLGDRSLKKLNTRTMHQRQESEMKEEEEDKPRIVTIEKVSFNLANFKKKKLKN